MFPVLKVVSCIKINAMIIFRQIAYYTHECQYVGTTYFSVKFNTHLIMLL